MFRRTIAAFSIFFCLTIAIAYWNHVRLRHSDRTAYRHFVHENSTQRARHALENHPATQNREKVQKDFWIIQNHQRQHLRVQSEHSELIIHERKGKLEAVEKLRNLECWLQEGVCDEPSILQKPIFGSTHFALQQVRHLTADEGIYFYPSHHFLAQIVHLQFFRLPGRDLPLQIDSGLAFFSGTATEASFSACGKSPTFTAQHLHASFDPMRGLP
ncbi:MAG: hypothetical protein HW387_1635 [Parachlamydiales bacterium]|nr:hypothetical protein [Parachlamydiales bacterium]